MSNTITRRTRQPRGRLEVLVELLVVLDEQVDAA
jgi:hypothetical protein